MAVFSERMTAFVSSRISYLKNLKSQTEQQQMFVELGRKFFKWGRVERIGTARIKNIGHR